MTMNKEALEAREAALQAELDRRKEETGSPSRASRKAARQMLAADRRHPVNARRPAPEPEPDEETLSTSERQARHLIRRGR